jgi:hypothetical protein
MKNKSRGQQGQPNSSGAESNETPAKQESNRPDPTVSIDADHNVQSSIYSMLHSALFLSEEYETHPGVEERRRLLRSLNDTYLGTCNSTASLSKLEA